MRFNAWVAVALTAPMGVGWAGGAQAATYRYHVNCPGWRLVVEWQTSAIDLGLGREYLRVATEQRYPGCIITNYDPVRDTHVRGRGLVLAGLRQIEGFVR
jgi:hypothetical protein